MPRKIVIFGARGQVGWELQRSLCCLGQVVPVNSSEANLSRPEDLRALLADVRPAVIVNAAAYTAVDKAESEVDQARMVNEIAPAVLSEESKKLGSLFIHYSTDYVFDGESDSPYTELSPTAPLNVYGMTKLAGDQAVLGAGGKHLIFRTSWVYSTRGSNFLLTMLRLAKEQPILKVVSDQIGAPTSALLIAQVTAAALSQMLAPGTDLSTQSGLYNLTSSGVCSWYDFAREIFFIGNSLWGNQQPQLKAISSTEYPRPALRPKNSHLSGERLRQSFGIEVPVWQVALRTVLESMGNE